MGDIFDKLSTTLYQNTEDDYEVTRDIEETSESKRLPNETHGLLLTSSDLDRRKLDYLLRNSSVVEDYRIKPSDGSVVYVSMIYRKPEKFDTTINFFARIAQLIMKGVTENDIKMNSVTRRIRIIESIGNYTTFFAPELMKLAHVESRDYYDVTGVINLNEMIRKLWNLFNEDTKPEIDEDIKNIGFFLGWRDIRYQIMYKYGGYALPFKFYYEYDYPEHSVYRSRIAEINHPIILRGKNILELYSRFLIFLDILKMKHSPLLTERVRMTDVTEHTSLSLTGIIQEWCRIENPDLYLNDTALINAELEALNAVKNKIQTLKPNDPMYYIVFEEALNKVDVNYVMDKFSHESIDIITNSVPNYDGYLSTTLGVQNGFVYYNKSYEENEQNRRYIQ